MTAQKPYREYKDSGVEWVGIHPQHWSVELVKRSAYVKARVGWKGLTSDEFEDAAHAYLVTGTDFQGKFIDWRNCYQVSRERYEDDPYIQLQNGDLLITKDGTIGKLAVVRDLDKPACLNSGIFVVRPLQSLSSDYLYWVLESAIFRQFVRATSTGSTILHLYQNVFVQFAFPYPPVEEQRAIASYLDHETAEIDAFIADQQELIGLLNERRAATITQAVTKGLDPDVAMKGSGVEWLGDVPAGWAVSRIKHVGTTHIGLTYSPSDIVGAQQDGVLVLRSGNVQDGRLHYADSVYVNTNIPPSIRTREGDILICARNGSRALIGKNAVITQEAAGQTFGAFMTVLRSPANRFISWVLNSSIFQAQMGLFVTATINQLTNSTLNNFELPFPPVKEQHAIADYLDRETAEIDATIADAKEAIELSKERRAALISAAVTGKIDVRDHPAARGAA